LVKKNDAIKTSEMISACYQTVGCNEVLRRINKFIAGK